MKFSREWFENTENRNEPKRFSREWFETGATQPQSETTKTPTIFQTATRGAQPSVQTPKLSATQAAMQTGKSINLTDEIRANDAQFVSYATQGEKLFHEAVAKSKPADLNYAETSEIRDYSERRRKMQNAQQKLQNADRETYQTFYYLWSKDGEDAALKWLNNTDHQQERYQKARTDKARASVYAGMKNADDFGEQAANGQKQFQTYMQNVKAANRGEDVTAENTGMTYVGHEKFEEDLAAMTPDERNTFYYVWAKGGAQRAKDYLDFLRDSPDSSINNAIVQGMVDYAKEVKQMKPGFDKGLAYATNAVSSGMGRAMLTMPQLFTDEEVNTNSIDAFNQEMTKDMSAFGRMAYGAGNSIGGMLPSIGASILTGNPIVGASVMGVSSGGSAMNEMLKQGYSAGQARTYGALVGASEALMQYFLGGISKLSGGKGLGQAAIKNLSHIDNALVRYIGTMGLNIAKEIGEEELQLFLEPLIKAAVTGEEYDAPTWQAMLETAISTAISTGVLEVGNTTAYSPNAANTKTSEQVSPEAVEVPSPQNYENVTIDGYETKHPTFTKEEIASNSMKLAKMDPVYSLTGKEFPRGEKSLKDQVLDFFASIGNNVRSELFGDVALNKSSWRSEQRHGLTNKKAISFSAVPSVIKKGVVIDVFEKHDGVERVVVAAPITIFDAKTQKDELHYMGVMLQRDARNQRLYLHDVITEKYQGGQNHTQTGASADSEGVSRSSTYLDISTILRNALNVNTETALDPVTATFQQAQEQQNAANEAIAAAQNGVSADDSVGAAKFGFAPYSHAIGEYGAMEPGKNASRIVDIPVSMDGASRVRQGVRTAAESAVTTDEFLPLIGRGIQDGDFSYMRVTNNETVQKAIKSIQKKGWNDALASWQESVRNGVTSPEIEATGALLYNNALHSGNKELAYNILVDFETSGTNAARSLGIRRIMRTMSPMDRLYMIEKTIDRMAELRGMTNGLELDKTLVDEYLNAKTEQQRNEVVTKMQKDVAKRMPTKLLEAFQALRYTNMLGNLRTQVNNFENNALVALAYRAKDAANAGIELLASALSKGKYQRTALFFVSKEHKEVAKAFYDENKDFLTGGLKYQSSPENEFMRGVEKNRRIFKVNGDGKVAKVANALLTPLEGYRKVTQWATEAGDVVFSKARFATSLGGWLEAHKISAQDFADPAWREQNEEIVGQAVDYAMKESQEATLRDQNEIAKWVNKIARGKKTPLLVRFGVEGAVPFRATPVNALIRIYEFSPAGLADVAAKIIEMKKGGTDITGADVINSLSKVLTGGAMLGLGALLKSMGWIQGKADDEDQEDLEGRMEWSLEIPGTDISIDLAQFSLPASLMYMGAAFYEAMEETDGNIPESVWRALTETPDILIETSMLMGVNQTLEDIRYSEQPLLQTAANALMNYVTAGFTNSLARQFERVFEDERTMTYVDKESSTPEWLQKTLGEVSRSIPGWDYQQVPYVDAWGRKEEKVGTAENVIQNLFNPTKVSHIQETEADKEIKRLEDARPDDGDLTPNRPDKKLKGKNLTDEQYVARATQQGQTDLAIRQALLQNSGYDVLPDNMKHSAHQYSMTVAAEAGKEAAGVGYKTDTKWIADLFEQNASKKEIADAIILRTIQNSLGDGVQKWDNLETMHDRGQVNDAIVIALLPQDARNGWERYGGYFSSVDQLLNAVQYYNSKEAEGTKDANGNTVKGQSRKDKVHNWLKSQDWTEEQRQAAWVCLGYELKTY